MTHQRLGATTTDANASNTWDHRSDAGGAASADAFTAGAAMLPTAAAHSELTEDLPAALQPPHDWGACQRRISNWEVVGNIGKLRSLPQRPTALAPDFFSEHQAWCEPRLAAFRRLPLEEKWTMTILDFLLDPFWFSSFGTVHAHMALGLCSPPVPPFFPATIIEDGNFRKYLMCFCASVCGLIAGSGALEDPARRALFEKDQRFIGRKGNLALRCTSSTMETITVFAVAQPGESEPLVVLMFCYI